MYGIIKRLFVSYGLNFAPKLYEVIRSKGYNTQYFRRDAVAGLTLAIISIPLGMAFAIASGVSPAQGLYTAVVAGFFIALLGGCRYQIGGPTGAFVVIIFNTLQQYGYAGLTMTMLIAGIVMIAAGYLRLGTYIKYIPYPVVVGFTSGIAVLLFSTQVKDMLGLDIASVPAEFLPKWRVYLENLGKFSWTAVFITVLSFGIIFYVKFRRPKLPAFLLGVIGSTLIVALFSLHIDTIGSKFGGIPHFIPLPKIPEFDIDLALKVMPSALAIAFLASIESLLSATVVDAMSGDNTNANAELIGEGIANLASACFMGIPATGAIARSATNVKAKAYSPVSGIMQSVFILLFMLLLSPAAQYIPLACLSSVLIIIAYNMFNFPKFWHLLQGPRGDRITLIVTFLLTVMVDLNTAISVGFIMSSVIFMHRMSREIEVANDESVLEYVSRGQDISDTLNEKGVISLRLSGPLFFGGASQVSMFFRQMHDVPKVLIFRMGSVPVVDASGANILVEFIRKLKQYDTKIIFSHLKAQPRRVLHDALTKEGLIKDISTASNFENAVKMTKRYLRKLEADKTDKSVDF
ncbi:MAG: SulP family inorganic anion transporter [Alphaproteobacteria bacterium]|jgi:sulfate transporter|uniref:SulP family inorganic anion transporter n=1 Tax=Candidatus Scatocola faecigallinarum TaxID=2840916 RepID=UPI00033948F1|nr:STAS domain-containing protein [Azospirillum sp.]CDB53516.1 sulfate permease and related transporters [Azospirillum sp. CAG:239]